MAPLRFSDSVSSDYLIMLTRTSEVLVVLSNFQGPLTIAFRVERRVDSIVEVEYADKRKSDA